MHCQATFYKIYSQDGSNSNKIISGLSSPNEDILKPILYLQKSNFQRNKWCSKILSNEKVTTILLKHSLLAKKVWLTEVATEPKFGRPKWRRKCQKQIWTL